MSPSSVGSAMSGQSTSRAPQASSRSAQPASNYRPQLGGSWSSTGMNPDSPWHWTTPPLGKTTLTGGCSHTIMVERRGADRRVRAPDRRRARIGCAHVLEPGAILAGLMTDNLGPFADWGRKRLRPSRREAIVDRVHHTYRLRPVRSRFTATLIYGVCALLALEGILSIASASNLGAGFFSVLGACGMGGLLLYFRLRPSVVSVTSDQLVARPVIGKADVSLCMTSPTSS